MQEFQRARGMGRYQGVDIDDPDAWARPKEHYPFIETHDLEGDRFSIPNDGDIDPAQVTQALGQGGAGPGSAKILRFCPATGVQAGRRRVDHRRRAKGEIRCEYVVNAAGYYAQRVGEMVQALWRAYRADDGDEPPVPLCPRRYAELAAWCRSEMGGKLPLLRDVDSSYYLRQEKNGLQPRAL